MANNYLALVEHCTHIINNQPGGITWARLLERVHSLNGASKREKTQVFQYLRNKNTIWNNQADDMSDTLFMAGTEVSASELAEASTTTVSAKVTEKKERLKKFEKINTDKTHKPVAFPATPTPAPAKVIRLPTSKTGIIFGDNELIDEDDVITEMAWHVYESGEHGMTLNSLRMSVPEFSDCEQADRAYLIVQMRKRYGIGYYEKEVIGDRVIKVLAKRTGSDYGLDRPDWFIKMGRQPFVRPDTNLVELRPQIATFGNVGGNAMADQLAQLNAAALFTKNAGTEEDEFDEDEDDSEMVTDGKLGDKAITAADIPETMAHLMSGNKSDFIVDINKSDDKAEEPLPLAKPSRDFVKEWTQERPVNKPTAASAPAAAPSATAPKESGSLIDTATEDKPYSAPVEPPVTSPVESKATEQASGVSKKEISQTADTLRLIAAQLENQAQSSEVMREKKARFDALMLKARQSSVDIQNALNKHNELLDNLQSAASDLASL